MALLGETNLLLSGLRGLSTWTARRCGIAKIGVSSFSRLGWVTSLTKEGSQKVLSFRQDREVQHETRAFRVVELSPKVGDVGNRKGGISWGCSDPTDQTNRHEGTAG